MGDSRKEEYDFSRAKQGRALPIPPGKERITIRLDADILDWFRRQAEEQGCGNYQTMINQALREYMLSQSSVLEDLLRRIVREELAQYKP
ncbi:MAG: BrnA antitoxin family protein [Chloroflexi bacterium]|nr:BrnA antitoxin family protein [Chloroflexota bacterium]